MRKLFYYAVSAAFITVPVFAGALTLQVDDVRSNSEAMARNAAVAAHITACHSPEKTVVTATAEGIENGKLRSIPVKVIALGRPGEFAVVRQWPAEGRWTVTMVATNPDYRNYATSVVVPIHDGVASRAEAKVFYHAASQQEIYSVVKTATLE